MIVTLDAGGFITCRCRVFLLHPKYARLVPLAGVCHSCSQLNVATMHVATVQGASPAFNMQTSRDPVPSPLFFSFNPDEAGSRNTDTEHRAADWPPDNLQAGTPTHVRVGPVSASVCSGCGRLLPFLPARLWLVCRLLLLFRLVLWLLLCPWAIVGVLDHHLQAPKLRQVRIVHAVQVLHRSICAASA